MSNPSSAIVGQGTKIAALIAAITVSTQFIASTKKLTRTTGSWITDGVLVGMTITTNDGTNPGPFTASVVTALEITVIEVVVDVAAASKIITPKMFFGEITGFNGPGGAATVIDVTTLESTAKEKRMGLPDEGQFQIDFNFVPSGIPGAGQKFLRDKRTALAKVDFEVTFTDSIPTKATFSGFVLEFSVQGGVDDKVSGSSTIEITGAVVYA